KLLQPREECPHGDVGQRAGERTQSSLLGAPGAPLQACIYERLTQGRGGVVQLYESVEHLSDYPWGIGQLGVVLRQLVIDPARVVHCLPSPSSYAPVQQLLSCTRPYRTGCTGCATRGQVPRTMRRRVSHPLSCPMLVAGCLDLGYLVRTLHLCWAASSAGH